MKHGSDLVGQLLLSSLKNVYLVSGKEKISFVIVICMSFVLHSL